MEDALIKGEIYKIFEGEEHSPSFYMIGLITEPNNGDNDKSFFRGNATFFSKQGKGGDFRKDSPWCYYQVGGKRKFVLASPKERYWLQQCIKAKKFIPMEDINFDNLEPQYEIY